MSGEDLCEIRGSGIHLVETSSFISLICQLTWELGTKRKILIRFMTMVYLKTVTDSIITLTVVENVSGPSIVPWGTPPRNIELNETSKDFSI